MKTTLISKEKNIAKFTMEFTAEEFDAAIIKAYQETKGNYVVDGFRKGKAPRKLIEARYGETVFFEEAIDELFRNGYANAIEELALDVIARPMADFSELKQGEGFTMTIEVECYPEITPQNYKGVEIAEIKNEVGEAEVDAEMENLRKRNARMEVVERAAQNGDTVILDYSGFVGEEQFEGGTAERFQLKLGSGMFIPGFEEQLVGVAAGESKDVKVTFPTEYHAEHLAGAEATFKCLVHEVKEEQLPELDDEFVKDISEFDTIAELREETKNNLVKAAEAKALNEMKAAGIEKVCEANNIDVPAAMVEDEIDARLNEFSQQLRYQNITIEQYCEFIGKEMKDLRDDLREDCTKAVKTRMLLTAIAEAEAMTVEQEDIDKELDLMAMQYRMDKEKIREMVGAEYLSLLDKDIKVRKAIDFIFDNAIVK